MGIHSYLTKGVRRTKENTKSQNTNSSIKKGNHQRNNDSEATSFIEDRIGQKKILEKSNSKKLGGLGSFRLSRRRPKSPLTSLPDDGSAPTPQPAPTKVSNPSPDRFQKPVPKFTRSGSLRSLRILRNKNRLPSESKKSSNVKDLHSKKSTFSSILKEVKSPEHEEHQLGVKEGEEVLSVGKLCSYHHCSLHGHHHHYEPRFAYLKRRSSNDQKSLNPQTTNTRPGKKTDVKVTKKVSNESAKSRKDEDADFSIEFYAKTRSKRLLEAICDCDDVDMADIMFGIRKEHDSSETNRSEGEETRIRGTRNDQNEPNLSADDLSGSKKEKPIGWSDVKKFVLLKRFITELEKAKELGANKHKHIPLVTKPEPEPDSEPETVSLRRQTIGENKNSDEWMLDYALRQVVSELGPTQKRKVALLVKAFETVAPRLK